MSAPDAVALHAYQLVLWLWAFGLAVTTFEFLTIIPSFSKAGVYAWRITELRLPTWLQHRSKALLKRLFEVRGVRVLLLTRAALLLLVVAAPIASLPFSLGMGLLVLTNLAFTWRRIWGDDGSDQMSSIILITIFLCVGPHSTPFLLQLGLWFLALEACLSYTASGIAKIGSEQWRNGEAVFRILNTGAYGIPWVARFLEPRKRLNFLLAWSVVGVESLFPLVLILPEPWNWNFLVWGAIFHLMTAVVMGLNSFFWAFVATYPAIVYIAWHFHLP
jgi:hypothetical protein